MIAYIEFEEEQREERSWNSESRGEYDAEVSKVHLARFSVLSDHAEVGEASHRRSCDQRQAHWMNRERVKTYKKRKRVYSSMGSRATSFPRALTRSFRARRSTARE